MTTHEHEHDERVDALCQQHTRDTLHALATSHGWNVATGNKRVLAAFVATSEPLGNNVKTTDHTADTVNHTPGGDTVTEQNAAFSRVNAALLTHADVRTLVERATGNRPADDVTKGTLLDVLFPPDALTPVERADAKRADVDAQRGTVCDVVRATCPVLALACDAVHDALERDAPDAALVVSPTDVVYVAALVVDDCRLRADASSALVALHVRTSAHNRRFQTVVRRLVAVTFPTLHRHARFALTTAVVPALCAAFPNDDNGRDGLAALFDETANAFPVSGATSSGVAAPLV